MAKAGAFGRLFKAEAKAGNVNVTGPNKKAGTKLKSKKKATKVSKSTG